MSDFSQYKAIADELIEVLEKMMSPRVGSHVTWNSSGGSAFGKITRIVRSGKVDVPGSSFTLTATESEPVALIALHDKDHKPTGQIVGHKLSTVKVVE
jgi:hypothetical protein